MTINAPAMYFYSIYSKSLDYYNVPFFASSDKEAINTVRLSVLSGPDRVLANRLDDLQLCKVGSFDTEKGVITGFGPVNVIDLPDIPLIQDHKEESK